MGSHRCIRSLPSALVFLAAFPISVDAFGVLDPVGKLLNENAPAISRLKEVTTEAVGDIGVLPYSNDVFYLRYVVDEKGEEELKKTLEWRQGDGKAICEAAVAAVTAAMVDDSKWDNGPVRDGAPSADTINPYITPSTSLTTSTSKGDLVYCIRAGFIDDAALMKSVGSIESLVDFFLYCKEVNSIVANDRSLDQDRLVYVITANDLQGLKLIGGDSNFRKALGAASKQANELYPALAGPTLLLNLPRIVSALVKLFTPLFPPEVNARLKFERGPLADIDELMDISYGGKSRDEFLADLDRLCY